MDYGLYPGTHFLAGHNRDRSLNDSNKGILAYRAARQGKRGYAVPLFAVWLDNENYIFLASSGGNYTVSGAHGKHNTIYVCKSRRFGSMASGLFGGKLVSWQNQPSPGLADVSCLCAPTVATYGRPRDI